MLQGVHCWFPVLGTFLAPVESLWEETRAAALVPEFVILLGVVALAWKCITRARTARTPSAIGAIQLRLGLLRRLGVIVLSLDVIRTLCAILFGVRLFSLIHGDPLMEILLKVYPALLFTVAGLILFVLAMAGSFVCESILAYRTPLSEDGTQHCG